MVALGATPAANAQDFVISVEQPASQPFLPPDRAVLSGESGSTALTEIQANASQATMSPDGQRVAYVETDEFPWQAPRARLVVEPATGGVAQVLRTVERPEYAVDMKLHKPAFSPSGSKIALGCEAIYNQRQAPSRTASKVASESPDCLANVEEVDAAGGGAIPLISTRYVRSARYVDDGEGLIYDQDSGTGAGRFLHERDHNGDGTHPLPPMDGVANAEDPIASPDGTQIAFEGRTPADSTWKIFVYDLGEQETRAVSPGEGRNPTWTPDGASIAYVNGSGAHQVNATTGAQTTLLSGPVEAGGKSYSKITSIAYPQPRTLDNLAQRFRPNLYFDTSERFRPLNVPNFFRERDDYDDPLHQGCTSSASCQGLMEANSLRNFPGGGDFLDIGQISTTYRPPDYNCSDQARVDCNEGTPTSTYYNLTESSPEGYTYADYWHFYRFNDFPGGLAGDYGGDHEGDWESVTLAFANGLQSTTFDYAQFSQHGHWSRYLRGTLQCDGQDDGSCGDDNDPRGQRVSVYVANGSHANYPRGCGASPAEVPTCPRVDENGDISGFLEAGYDGEREYGENGRGRLTSLVRFPPAAGWEGTGPKNWTDWPGRWGRQEPGVSPLEGPKSPGLQPHYSNPGDSVCVRENPDNGCDDRKSNATGSTSLVDDRRCQPWVGALVVAAVCDGQAVSNGVKQRRLGTPGEANLKISRKIKAAEGLRSDSAPGIAQVVGRPLRVGDRVRLTGKRNPDARLYLTISDATRVRGVRFDDPPTDTQLTVTRDAAAMPVLRSSTGRVLPAKRTVERAIR